MIDDYLQELDGAGQQLVRAVDVALAIAAAFRSAQFVVEMRVFTKSAGTRPITVDISAQHERALA